jgi:twitching motility protein PilI
LAVQVGSANYLLPLTQSGEIFSMATLANVPYVQPWFMGVVNLRGGLFGVVDLASFLKVSSTRSRTEQAWAQTRLITFNVDLEINAALLVDALIGLRRQDAFVGVMPPPAGAPEFFGQLLVDAQGASWQEINLRTLAQSAEFLSIGV